VVGVNCGIERSKILNFKTVIDDAIGLAGSRVKHTVIYNRPNFGPAELQHGRDIDWDRGMESAVPHHCVPVDANDPLYVLYTSGTTGQPKGVVRPSGSHAVILPWTMENVYGMKKNEVPQKKNSSIP
jgi:propionyl-CoA synthetase